MNTVGQYKGLPQYQELELWLTKFTMMLQAIQYSGDECDLEHMLAIPKFLEGEVEKWFCQHVIHVN